MAKEKILLSACLAGINCVYDGTNKLHPVFNKMFQNKEVVIFCPEALGGMKIPHPPSEIVDSDGFAVLKGKARVVSAGGKDVTAYFLEGAQKTLKLAQKNKIKKAILKSKSPSCGCGLIHDGTFCGKLTPGFGVTAALLQKNGIEVISDVEYLQNEKLKVKSEKFKIKKESLKK